MSLGERAICKAVPCPLIGLGNYFGGGERIAGNTFIPKQRPPPRRRKGRD